jgi:hypothetical protein
VGEGFVRVFSTHSWLVAEIVKGRLEAEGILVDLSGEHEAMQTDVLLWLK